MLLWFIEAIPCSFAKTFSFWILSPPNIPSFHIVTIRPGRVIRPDNFFYYPAYPVSGRIAKSTIRCIPSFWAFARRLNVRDCTPHRLLMRPCWCLTGQDGPPPPPLRGRPHRLTAGRGAAVPAPARTVSGSVSYCRGPVRGEKQQTFYKCTQKWIILFHRGTRNPSLEDMERWYFTLRSNFPTAMSRLFGN